MGTITVASLSGCLSRLPGNWGANKELKIVNNYSEPVVLKIIVEESYPVEEHNRERVFEGNVSVAPGKTKTLDVLGDLQFRITVTGLDQEMSFLTRPICQGARTVIIIRESGELQNDVVSCE